VCAVNSPLLSLPPPTQHTLPSYLIEPLLFSQTLPLFLSQIGPPVWRKPDNPSTLPPSLVCRTSRQIIIPYFFLPRCSPCSVQGSSIFSCPLLPFSFLSFSPPTFLIVPFFFGCNPFTLDVAWLPFNPTPYGSSDSF